MSYRGNAKRNICVFTLLCYKTFDENTGGCVFSVWYMTWRCENSRVSLKGKNAGTQDKIVRESSVTLRFVLNWARNRVRIRHVP